MSGLSAVLMLSFFGGLMGAQRNPFEEWAAPQKIQIAVAPSPHLGNNIVREMERTSDQPLERSAESQKSAQAGGVVGCIQYVIVCGGLWSLTRDAICDFIALQNHIETIIYTNIIER